MREIEFSAFGSKPLSFELNAISRYTFYLICLYGVRCTHTRWMENLFTTEIVNLFNHFHPRRRGMPSRVCINLCLFKMERIVLTWHGRKQSHNQVAAGKSAARMQNKKDFIVYARLPAFPYIVHTIQYTYKASIAMHYFDVCSQQNRLHKKYKKFIFVLCRLMPCESHLASRSHIQRKT